VSRVEQNPAVPPPVREAVTEVAQKGIPIVPVEDIEQAALDRGLAPTEATAIADDYGDAQLDGLKPRDRRDRRYLPALVLVHATAARTLDGPADIGLTYV
jgi:hypothetical protein